ncbi:MAG: hypothetical protein P4M04_09960 [Acidobacteriota bacterium]|nr:hypothetical protein [Acidobacteriota bacterium]
MVTILKRFCVAPVLLMVFAPADGASQSTPSSGIVDQVQQKIASYLDSLADLHCAESVTQERLASNGHVETEESAKYDYLIMMQGGNDDFELNETRVALSPAKSKSSPASMLVSNGIATSLLIFHPYYRDSFKFEIGKEETTDGRQLVPIHFEQIPGRRSPAALALRGREYPLELQGTAWVDKDSHEVVRIDAELLNDMSDVGLRALKLHVEYKSVPVGNTVSSVDLPAMAVVDVTTPRQHWRNTHVFDAYKSFSIDVEQNANVKVRAENPATVTGDSASGTATDSKEKP